MKNIKKTLIQLTLYSSLAFASANGSESKIREIDCKLKRGEVSVDNFDKLTQKDVNIHQISRQRATSTSKLLDQKYQDTAYSRVLKYIGNQQIPESLKPLSEVLNSISDKVTGNDLPDIIDIIFLLEGCGKTHAMVITEFLSVIEDRLAAYSEARFPGINLKLSAVVDAFVGAGSGAIPAAVAAVGNLYLRESIPTLRLMNSTPLVPKSIGNFCGFFGNCRKTSHAVASAYFDKSYVATDEDNNNWNSLTYDAFNFQKRGGKGLIELFGSASTADLQSSLEVVSLANSDSIIDLVLGSLSAKDSDAKSRFKKLALAETFNTAADILTVASDVKNDDSFTKNAEEAISAIEKVQVVLKKSDDKKSGTISEFREKLISRQDIPRDLIVVSISADTSDKKIIIPSFGFTVKHTANAKNIINMNYRFAIPSYLYNPKPSETHDYENILSASVSSVFTKNKQNDFAKKDSKVALASEMLINFLGTCNNRVLDEVDKLSLVADINEGSRMEDISFFDD